MSGMANHATGVVPFIWSDYLGDIENLIGCNYIFETLAYLETPWVEGGNTEVKTVADNNGAIDAVAKLWKPVGKRSDIFIIATNRSDKKCEVSFTLPEAKAFKRLYVIRENRTVKLDGKGGFQDTFYINGVHVYTTCEQIPFFQSLADIRKEIDAIKKVYPKGNILRNGSIDWAVGVGGRNCKIYGHELADGAVDTGGWLPWYENKKELVLTFPQGAKFNRLVFYSGNIKDADLEIWDYGKWRKLKTWQDRRSFKSIWSGKTCETVKLRLKINKLKYGRGREADTPNITELEIYSPKN